MNRPWTSKPASRSSSAATAESTPPERPTITRTLEFDMRLLYRQERLERQSHPAQGILDTAQHQRGAKRCRPRGDLCLREPMGSDDRRIEHPVGGKIADRTAEGKAHGRVPAGAAPLIDTEQPLRREPPRGLLQHLAYHRINERFPILEVSGWLIEHQAAANALLYQQESRIAFDHGGDCDVGLKDHAKGYPAARRRGEDQRRAIRTSRSSVALACQTPSNSCRYWRAIGGLLKPAMPSARSARTRYTIPRSSAMQ